MATVTIQPGLVVLWQGSQWEVRLIIGEDEVELSNISTGEFCTAKVGELDFPRASFTSRNEEDDFDYYEKDPQEIAKAKRRYRAFVRFTRADGKVDADKAARALKISRAQVYQLLRRFDIDEGFSALLRRKPGRKSGSRMLTPRVELIISDVIKEEFKEVGLCYQKIFEGVRSKCNEGNIRAPSLKAVTSRVKSRGGRELVKQKYGKESARQRYGARPYKYETQRPLQVVQADHTKVDIVVCDEMCRQPLCRPWVTMIIDLFTRVVLGFYLTLFYPSRHVVATCMMHAVLPKTKWLKRIGDESINYPYFGKPEAIHIDNAPEFRSRDFQWACNKNSIGYKYRKEKHYGGHIERLIGTFMGKVHFLPGTTHSNVVRKGEYDSEKESAITFRALLIWFAREVERYHLAEHSELNMSPAEKWREFFTDEAGSLHMPPIVENAETFRIDFLPSELRNIHPCGVLINCQSYWSESLRPYVGTKKALVKYDPESIYKVWVKVDEKRYIETPCRDLSTEDCTLYEWNKLLKTKRRKPSEGDVRRSDELAQKNRDLINSEKKETKAARISSERKKVRGLYHETAKPSPSPSPSDSTNDSKVPESYYSSREEDE